MGKKSNRAEMKERIYTVYSMLLDSYDTASIKRYGTQTWGVAVRAVENYISEANKLIEKDFEKRTYHKLYRSVAKRMKLHTRALKANDLNLAHEILRDLDKLDGLYPAVKHKIDGTMTLSDFLRNERITPEDSEQ